MLIITASCIVFLLGSVALYYQVKLARHRVSQNAKAAYAGKQWQQRRKHINKSIQVLAGSVGKQELTFTEAAIRISVLLDALAISEQVKSEFIAFYLLRDRTSHIPILEKWKVLSAQEKASFNRERKTLEAECSEAILSAALRLQGVYF